MKKILSMIACLIIASLTVDAQWFQNGTVVYNTNSGNVGIGNQSPYAKLDVIKGSNNYALLLRDNIPGSDSYLYHVFSSSYHLIGSGKNGTGLLRKIGFAIGTSDSESDLKMTIDINGNVGIGTTVPDAKLAVRGIIHTQEVKVDLNVPGPDYVFETSYNLPTLEALNLFITKHKHLPEIPSATEMSEEGVNLSEMNMLLLKKIEELTLYLIEQNKINQEQQARIEWLSSQFYKQSK